MSIAEDYERLAVLNVRAARSITIYGMPSCPQEAVAPHSFAVMRFWDGSALQIWSDEAAELLRFIWPRRGKFPRLCIQQAPER